MIGFFGNLLEALLNYTGYIHICAECCILGAIWIAYTLMTGGSNQ